jgi:flagellar export protein FliJ
MQEVTKSLKAVLKVKRHQENKAHLELVHIRREKQEGFDALDRLHSAKDGALVESIRALRIRATELQVNRAFVQKLTGQIQKQEKLVQKMQTEEDTKRNELVEKTQAKKMMEKLNEKRVAERSKEYERKEQRLIDVLAQRVRLEY